MIGADKSTEDILKKLEDKPLQKDLPQAVMNRIEENDEYGRIVCTDII